jgi:hypothetical protein
VDGVVDLVAGEAASVRRHAVPVEDVADRSSVNAEPGTQLVGCRTKRIVLDQRLDLVGVELPCPPRLRPIDGGGAGAVGSGSFRSNVSSASTCVFVL